MWVNKQRIRKTFTLAWIKSAEISVRGGQTKIMTNKKYCLPQPNLALTLESANLSHSIAPQK